MQPILDSWTILATALFSLLFISILILAVTARRGRTELLVWNVGNLGILGALATAVFRETLPPPLFVFLFDGCMLLAFCGIVLASVVLLAGRPLWWGFAASSTLTLACVVILSFLPDSAPTRASIISLFAALLFAWGAQRLRVLARLARLRSAPNVLAAIYLLAALFFFARALYYGFFAKAGSFQDLSLYSGRSQLIVLIFFVCCNFSLLVLFMTCLEREIAGKVFELGESRNDLQILYDAFAETAGSIELEELIPRMLDLLYHRLKTDTVAIYLLAPGGEELLLVAQRGFDAESLHALTKPQKGSGVAWKAVEERHSVTSLLADYPESIAKEALLKMELGITGGFPIATRGEALGALTVGYKQASDLDASRITLLETLCLQFGSVLRAATLHNELDRANTRLDNLASTDALTGLANRRAAIRALDIELARAKRNSSDVAVIMCDIDFFKDFNDHHGHDCGDYVLAKTAGVFQDAVRATDLAARWGGEEFLVVLGSAERSGVLALAERLRSRVEDALWEFAGKRLSVTMTLGVAIGSPEGGGEALISAADEALYAGKRAGRNRVSVAGGETLPDALPEPQLADFEGPSEASEAEGILDLLPLED